MIKNKKESGGDIKVTSEKLSPGSSSLAWTGGGKQSAKELLGGESRQKLLDRIQLAKELLEDTVT